MKKQLLITSCLLLMCAMAWSQTKPVKIVFDVNSNDTLVQQTAFRHVSGMATSYPESKFEVVIYGGALPMVMKDKSTIAKGIMALEGNKNVSFKVCAITMKRYNVDKSQLLSGIEIVPDGIMEIVTKQNEGWGYIKEASY